jgi:hypothetical protein
MDFEPGRFFLIGVYYVILIFNPTLKTHFEGTILHPSLLRNVGNLSNGIDSSCNSLVKCLTKFISLLQIIFLLESCSAFFSNKTTIIKYLVDLFFKLHLIPERVFISPSNAERSDDFPEPTFPTTATSEPGGTFIAKKVV